MAKVSFEAFKKMNDVPILSEDDLRSWGSIVVSRETRRTLADNLIDYPLSASGSWATYLGNQLGVDPPDSLEAQYRAVKERLTNEFIIVELNWAGEGDGAKPYGGEPYTWHNFHDWAFHGFDAQWKVDENGAAGHHPNGVYRLAQAVWNTPIEGAWVTDFWKGMPSSSGPKLNANLSSISQAERDKLEEGMVQILAKEAKSLGAGRPIWLVVGHDYDRVLRHARELVGDETWRIILIPHHSGGNQGYVKGKASMRRWCPEALTAMYDSIGKVRSALGLEWKVDTAEKTKFVFRRAS